MYLAPPRILQSLPATIGALSDQNLTLTCRVECQPPCEIHWFHNNLTRLSPDTRGILPSSLLTNEYRAKLRNGNEMTFSLINEQTEGVQIPAHTWSSITIHNTSVLFDFDQLTCVSSNSDNEELGPPVHSTVVFRRECKFLLLMFIVKPIMNIYLFIFRFTTFSTSISARY